MMQYLNKKTHILSMKGTFYFDYIMKGIKQFEGRVYAPLCHLMKVGDLLALFEKEAKWLPQFT